MHTAKHMYIRRSVCVCVRVVYVCACDVIFGVSTGAAGGLLYARDSVCVRVCGCWCVEHSMNE